MNHMNRHSVKTISVILLTLCALIISFGSSKAISSKDLIELRQKGYSDEQIREYIEKSRKSKPNNNDDDFDALNIIRERLSKIGEPIDIDDPCVYSVYVKLSVQTEFLKQYIRRVTPGGPCVTVYGRKEGGTIITLPYSAIRKIDIKLKKMEEGLNYRLLVTTKGLKKLALDAKEPFKFDRNSVSELKDALMQMKGTQ